MKAPFVPTHTLRGTPIPVVMRYANLPQALVRFERGKDEVLKDADFYAIKPALKVRA